MKSKPSPTKQASHHNGASARDRDGDQSHHDLDSRHKPGNNTHDKHERDSWDRHRDDNHCKDDFDSNDGPRGRDRSDCRYDAGPGERRNESDLDIDVDRHGKWLKIDLDVDTKLGSVDLDMKIDARLLQPDNTPMTALIGGEGNAVGDDTIVDAEIFSRLVDLGRVSVAFGSAVFESTAVSTDDLAFAAADTFLEVSGADFVISFTEKISTSEPLGDSLVAKETSKVTFVAVDFEDFDLLGGPVVVSSNSAQYLEFDGSRWCHENTHDQIDGNVAQLDVDAAAYSTTTLVDVFSSILTVENELSSVSALATTAAA